MFPNHLHSGHRISPLTALSKVGMQVCGQKCMYLIGYNVLLNCIYTVLEADSEEIVPSSSSNLEKDPSTLSASNSSATSNQSSEETNSRRVSSNSSREATPVAVLNHFDRKGTSEKVECNHVCQVKGFGISSAREHRMQFYSNGFTNGLRSSAPMAVSLQLPQQHTANSIQIYTFKPEVIANPLLLLASCATQLHKAHSTLSAKNNHSGS